MKIRTERVEQNNTYMLFNVKKRGIQLNLEIDKITFTKNQA